MNPEVNKNTETEPAITFNEWIDHLSQNLEAKFISPETVKSFLESCNANFNINPENKETLGKYSEKAKSDGMTAIWGEKWLQYKQWVKDIYIPEHEQETGENLPKLTKPKNSTSDKTPTSRKNSGMNQFLCELTSFAIQQITYEEFKKFTEIRIKNGTAWDEDKKSERIKVVTPTSKGKEILIGSYPKDFPQKAIEFLSRK